MTETTTRTEVVFAPSELVLLLGEQFAGPGSMAKGKEELLSGAGTVATNDLGDAVMLVALLSLEQAGLIRLEQRARKALFGLMTKQIVVAVRTGSPRPWPAGSIEPRLLAAVGAAEAEVADVIYDFFGENVGWPRSALLEEVKKGLVGRGLVERQETTKLKVFTTVTHSLPETTRGLLRAQSAEGLKVLVRAAEGKNGGAFIKALRKQIDGGFARRKEVSGGDSDGDGPDFSD